MPLRVNLPVKVYFNDKYAAYYLNTVIVDREKEPVHLLVLKNTGDYRKIQRREFFREEVKRKVKYRALDDNLHPVEPFSETYTIDISGGGIKMAVDKMLPLEGKVELLLDLPGLERSSIIGKVVNQYGNEDPPAVGVKFTDIDHQSREKIISWLFEYQRELRQKGLL